MRLLLILEKIAKKITLPSTNPLKHFNKSELEERIKSGECLCPTFQSDDAQPTIIRQSVKKLES